MPILRPALIVYCAALAAPSGVFAVGFGRVAPSAVLGQPLNVVIPIRLDQGERLFAECVQAEVQVGESTLPASQVRVAVQPTANPAEWTARITTVGPVEEPVVDIAVSAGCEKRFMRRFTAFADPPVLALSAPVVTETAPVVSALSAPVRIPRPGATGAGGGTPRREGAGSHAVAARPARPVTAPVVMVKRPPAEPKALAVAPRDTQVARLLLDVGGPRLKMDLEDPVFMSPVGGVAASGVAGEAGLDDADRLKKLEKTLGDLRRETQASNAMETGMKARLAEAESRSRVLPWLLGLLLLAAGVAVWLAMRLRAQGAARQQQDAQPSWWTSGAGAPDEGPVPEPPSSIAGELIDLPEVVAAAPAPVIRSVAMPSGSRVVPDTMPMDAHEQTEAFPGPAMSAGASAAYASIVDGATPAREVSVEELLDLEQQADFFIALGQEDAAVDLLMSHLRSTGGQSPLPYTKLLEIYRRQGDRSAYERIRARFNRRFNAYAPDWDVGPLRGRSLEDYPEVVLHLQGLWSSPLNAMAVLEAMLFRNDERQELFDLPAYKDVLLLYSLARDLYQQDGLSNNDVDLLLPLGDVVSPVLFTPAAPQGPEAYDLTAFSLDEPPLPPVDDGSMPPLRH